MYKYCLILLMLGFLSLSGLAVAEDADAALESAKALLEDDTEASVTSAPKKAKSQPKQADRAFEPETLEFAFGDNTLSEQHKGFLRQSILPALKNNPALKLEIQAYASGTAGQESLSRRLSLERALVIQAFLAENGVNERAIYPRPLGLRPEGQADVAILQLWVP